MLLSMTGHGQAQHTSGETSIWAEVRSVNNRYLKISVSTADRLAALEANIRQTVQEQLRRGSVYVSVNIETRRETAPDPVRLNLDLLRKLHLQIRTVDASASASALIGIPGIVENVLDQRPDADTLWNLVQPALLEALAGLTEMRRREGESMARDLLLNCGMIEHQLGLIMERAPAVSANYATRLKERINQLLSEHEVAIGPGDIAREVGIFADRCDISEETVRLQAHIGQFRTIIDAGQGDGRKLEFLTQEMLRETNTIGSKANDTEISRSVVEIKTSIERVREMTQNVE
jgi:uncharacterized protein (TIGR00255 family)